MPPPPTLPSVIVGVRGTRSSSSAEALTSLAPALASTGAFSAPPPLSSFAASSLAASLAAASAASSSSSVVSSFTTVTASRTTPNLKATSVLTSLCSWSSSAAFSSIDLKAVTGRPPSVILNSTMEGSALALRCFFFFFLSFASALIRFLIAAALVRSAVPGRERSSSLSASPFSSAIDSSIRSSRSISSWSSKMVAGPTVHGPYFSGSSSPDTCASNSSSIAPAASRFARPDTFIAHRVSVGDSSTCICTMLCSRRTAASCSSSSLSASASFAHCTRFAETKIVT
mmetsp:Transcript_59262/g.163648  ORF Transcript_59262/g.163648 Transcript_59262/m.163648 type:complete len:286 (-) Transcript_59262:477-1334(-)